jgi:NAD-dependent SIR2 family protein deacetylase
VPRREVQNYLIDNNPQLAQMHAEPAADGDALLDDMDFSVIDIPSCESCGGALKPNVVFFGENVPRERVDASYQALQQADALLVIGSSLMVYSGFRFARHANEQGQPVASINRGVTRADSMLSFKIDADCSELLPQLVAALSA